MTSGRNPKVVALSGVAGKKDYYGIVWELINDKNSDAQKMNLAVVGIEVGKAVRRHLHRANEEMYFILEGEGEVSVGSTVSNVSQGHAVFIPPDCAHTIRNSGTTMLRLVAIPSLPCDHVYL